ncbi:MAG: RecX family transcriptional regulator [Verrucomicrobia bacterium]|nr:RecX family transcriptional regulator [Verrucomicrobiota bacterium]
MTVTWQIQQEKILLFLEGEPWRTVGKKGFFSALKKTPHLTREEFSQLEIRLAKSYALYLLARRAYLTQDLEKKLRDNGYCKDAIQVAMETSAPYLDDAALKERLIAKERKKGLGSRRIAEKLRHKQIAVPLSYEEDLEALNRWLEKHAKQVEKLPREKLIARLARRGFPLDLIFHRLKYSYSV